MRKRLLLGYLALSIVVLALLEIPLAVTYARSERQSLVDRVERDAVAMATLAEDALEHGTAVPAQVRRTAASYQRDTGGRVVVVDASGRAAVDTASSGDELFATRPEIRTALSGSIATGRRHSNTLAADLLYVAVPVASGGVVHGAVRITYPMKTVDGRVHRYWLGLAAIAGLVLAAAGATAIGLTRWATRPLVVLEGAAERLGAGALDTRAPLEGPPEIRRLAATFNTMAAKLDGLVRSQDAFVADASHQLRTPLAALRLRLENLEHDVADDGRRDLEGALREVERLAGLVDGLLALARADRAPAVPQRADVRELVDERVAAWQPLAEERAVELLSSSSGGAAAVATPARLEQVLDNLLANALEVSPPGSCIRVSTSVDDGFVVVAVADEGPGMTAEERERAFDRFWRAGKGEGFGLGLPIVRRLVEADGGTVELRSGSSGGLRALVRLPAAGHGRVPTDEARAGKASSAGRGRPPETRSDRASSPGTTTARGGGG